LDDLSLLSLRTKEGREEGGSESGIMRRTAQSLILELLSFLLFFFTLDISLSLSLHHLLGVTKVHKLLYEACPEPLQVLDSIDSYSSSWKLPFPAMSGFTENFSSKAEELSMACQRDTITFRTMQQRDEASGTVGREKEKGGGTTNVSSSSSLYCLYVIEKRIATTVFPMNKEVMDVYNLQDEIELTFSMREFKVREKQEPDQKKKKMLQDMRATDLDSYYPTLSCLGHHCIRSHPQTAIEWPL